VGPHGSRASEIPNLSAWACLHAAGLRAAGHLGFARGVKSESWTSASGRLRGGKPFSRGALYLILQNRTYLGEIVHKGQSHPGEHTPIIDQPLWDAVQAQLSSNTTERSSCTRPRQPSLLTGLLFDPDGNPMTPTHAVKNGTRYRYYVSRPLITKGQSESSTGLRILAEGIERLVISRVRQWLLDPGSKARWRAAGNSGQLSPISAARTTSRRCADASESRVAWSMS
jgi:hypothetical protein